jgi:hypothetical protein
MAAPEIAEQELPICLKSLANDLQIRPNLSLGWLAMIAAWTCGQSHRVD